MGQWAGWSFSHLARLAGRSVGWLSGGLVGLLVGGRVREVGCMHGGYLVGCMVGSVASWLT